MKNIYQIIHIIGSMQGLFILILLLMRKENKLANKVLAAFIFLITLHMATAFFHTNNALINDLEALNRSDMFILYYGPILVCYILFLTGFKKEFRLRDSVHLIPAASLTVLLGLSCTYLSRTVLMSVWDGNDHFTLRIWYVVHALTLIHLLGYIIYGLVILNRYKKQLSSYFSHTGAIYLTWLRFLLLIFLFIWAFTVIQFFFNAFRDPEGVLQWIISVVSVITVYVMGIFAAKQPDILKDLDVIHECTAPVVTELKTEPALANTENTQSNPARYEKNRLSEEEERRNLELLVNYVSTEKPYLEPKLNLKQLSEAAGIPSHQISMLLNLYLNQSFNDFINKYRLEEAKRRLLEDVNKSENILTIAYDTGFNSKATFNAVFKKMEGVTPSQYRMMNKKC